MPMSRLTRVAGALAAVLLAATTAQASHAAPHSPTIFAAETPQLQLASRDDRSAGVRDLGDGARGRDTTVDDGGLPEPAIWVLMLIGVAMIGGALRGFVVTNRNLARLQPEDPD